ncbi:hypothetical protein HNQ36_003518 [Afipia massiliensis]|jgi:hypothetical protein|uniref:Uncharacterized protein n=1 Tax=Afipia massiliensis TaxID=211460 RepID=A0A840N6R0_9BRAD|nr:hypothetical protein [Afipia massiliensis]MBS4001880.1 hypothetical protein [Afipia sp.]
MAGFSRGRILHRDRFPANPTKIGSYSLALAENIPVFRGVEPEIGSIALGAGQIGEKFPSQLRLSVRREVCF